MSETLKTLAIDDNPADLELLRLNLEDVEGWTFAFTGVSEAEQAVEALTDDTALTFIDYRLGAMSGLDVYSALRENGYRGPVIMLTGQGNEEVAVEAMKAGVSDYVVKGNLSVEGLRLAIHNALERDRLQRRIDEQHELLLDAERQRVMMESLGAACHHFSQPLTTMMFNLQMLAGARKVDDTEHKERLKQCLKAAEMMREIVDRLQHLRDYRTRPYVDDSHILDIGLPVPEAPRRTGETNGDQT